MTTAVIDIRDLVKVYRMGDIDVEVNRIPAGLEAVGLRDPLGVSRRRQEPQGGGESGQEHPARAMPRRGPT